MNPRLLMTILAMCAGLALVSPLAFAEPKEEDSSRFKEMREKMEARKQELYTKLNLTDDQKKALEENKNQHRQEAKALRVALKEKRELLKKALQNPEMNVQEVKQIHNDIKGLQDKLMDTRLEGIMALRKILTPEQFKQFSTQMEDMKNQRKKQWGEHRRGEKMSEGAQPGETSREDHSEDDI